MNAAHGPLRVVVADDAPLFRQALAGMLAQAGHDVAQAADADALVAQVALTRPDVAVVDVRMPPDPRAGITAAARIRDEYPGVGVLLLSQDVEVTDLDTLLGDGGGGIGYLLKERVAGIDGFLEDLARVADGGAAVDPEVAAALVRRGDRAAPFGDLTSGETEVLRLMAEGRSNVAIAAALSVSEKTVEGRVGAILRKLRIYDEVDHNRRVMAVLTYLRASST